jgi:hypothetical protein
MDDAMTEFNTAGAAAQGNTVVINAAGGTLTRKFLSALVCIIPFRDIITY